MCILSCWYLSLLLILTVIQLFPFHGDVVLLFRENFICLLYLFLSLTALRTSLLSLLFMFEIPTFALLFFKILSPTLFLLFRWRAFESLVMTCLQIWSVCALAGDCEIHVITVFYMNELISELNGCLHYTLWSGLYMYAQRDKNLMKVLILMTHKFVSVK